MIAILKKNADSNAVAHLVSWIEKKGLTAHVSHGENETIIGLVGDTTKIDPFLLESMDIVQRVQRVSEPFKKANRKFHRRTPSSTAAAFPSAVATSRLSPALVRLKAITSSVSPVA